MISSELKKAREFEEREGCKVSEEERPVFHFSPLTGWLNDPNGFSYHDGKYHLFYQYHPYDSHWGPMHWGHAVSDDLIDWEYLPCAMAPDQPYDGAGCFSGSALTLTDGRHLLMYTGCDAEKTDSIGRWCQTQCIAVSSGSEYIKYDGNPVLTGDDLPEGGDTYEFRDPYIWQAADGSYRAVVSSARKGSAAEAPGGEAGGSAQHPKVRPDDLDIRGGTQLCLYRSDDGFSWSFDKVLYEDRRRLGIMWECPNFFTLDGRHVLIASPMDMEMEDAEGSVRFPKGNNVCYIVGSCDPETEEFSVRQSASHEGASRDAVATYHPVDCGLDFYAPQVMKAPDGRRIMIAWMQDPSTANLHKKEDFRIFGQMTVPRELRLRNDRLIQWPVREIEDCRSGQMISSSLDMDSETRTVEGIRGRVLDMEIEISPRSVSAAGMCSLEEFTIGFARDYEHCVSLIYRPDSSVLTIDRSGSGQAENMTKRRSIRVRDRRGHISLRMLLDRWSAEIFINGGEQVMSVTFYTPLTARDISFSSEGSAILDVTAYGIREDMIWNLASAK